MVTIEHPFNFGESSLSLTNTDGRVVWLNASNLPVGLYYISLVEEEIRPRIYGTKISILK